MENRELRECPFCGGEAVIDSNTVCAGHGDFYTRFQIRCRKCRKRGKVVYDCDGDDALRKEIERWNTMEHKCKKTDIKTVGKCKLNREKIIKALECCQIRSIENHCDECIFHNYSEPLCRALLCGKSRNLIHELTEENAEVKANWQKLKESHESDCKDCRAEFKRLTEENERLHTSCTELTQCCTKLETLFKIECKRVDTVRADTVRKMHSMLCEGRVSNDNVVIVANQVAKEMVEGEK